MQNIKLILNIILREKNYRSEFSSYFDLFGGENPFGYNYICSRNNMWSFKNVTVGTRNSIMNNNIVDLNIPFIQEHKTVFMVLPSPIFFRTTYELP